MNTFISQQERKIYTIAADTAPFFRSVYGWMAVGLITSAVSAYLTMLSPQLLNLLIGTPLFWILILVELVLVVKMTAFVGKASAQTVANLFVVYALINGVTLSIVLLAFTAQSIVGTFIVTAGMFGAMSLYGYYTKRDLSSWGNFFLMGLVGIILAGIVNIFLKNSGLQFMISIFGVLIFVGLTAYDVNRLKEISANVSFESDQGQKMAIHGALALYLDFINLFLHLLRFFGHRRD